MSMGDLALHFVCTLDEAKSIVDGHKKYWVSDCNCREHRGPCKRSRADVCLQFAARTIADNPSKHAATREEVDGIFEEAREKHLVPRPFRSKSRKGIDALAIGGICFCCDDCCGYFLGLHEPCDKGKLIERTDPALCIDCGICADVCRFGARAAGEPLKVDREKCYGCGVCVDACAMKAITMVTRN
ncbi:MAG TPA: 4Fe-4S binding protein [Methanocella sp.]|nr:4Fe-4S binding protein [Methanocella sp.]